MRTLLHLLLVALAHSAGAEPRLVAVLPLSTGSMAIEPSSREAVEETVRSAAGDSLSPLGWTVLASETTLSVLADNEVNPAKACEASCALDAARELKASLFLSPRLSKIEDTYVLFVRLFESKTGRQLASTEAQGTKLIEVRNRFRDGASAFFSSGLARIDQAGAEPARTPAPVTAPAPAPAPPPPRLTPRAPVRLVLDPDSGHESAQVAITIDGKRSRCDHALTTGAPCDFTLLPGTSDLHLLEPHDRRLSFDVPPEGGTYKLFTRSYWKGWTSLAAFGVFGLGFVIAGGEPDPTGNAQEVAGFIVLEAGILTWMTLGLWELFDSNAWVERVPEATEE